MPACVYAVTRNKETTKVLYTGWTPVIVAMSISSMGGLILNKAVAKFSGIAVFQPVFNGVGGNLVAVQASRISTYLHKNVRRTKNTPQCIVSLHKCLLPCFSEHAGCTAQSDDFNLLHDSCREC